MAKDEISRADELQAMGWSAEDVRRYADLWDYRHRWGAINLEPEDRAFLRKAEAALPKRVTGKAALKKPLQEKSHYRWLAFYREAMLAHEAAQQLNPGEQGAWPVLLAAELALLDELQPVLGLPDTLTARELVALREELVAQAAKEAGAAPDRSLSFDDVAPLEELKQKERTNWKPLRGEASADKSYPLLSADAVEPFRAQASRELGDWMRSHLPSLQG
ncbi:MAG: hypothetical protein ACK516_03035 [Cyanobium sp.]